MFATLSIIFPFPASFGPSHELLFGAVRMEGFQMLLHFPLYLVLLISNSSLATLVYNLKLSKLLLFLLTQLNKVITVLFFLGVHGI